MSPILVVLFVWTIIQSVAPIVITAVFVGIWIILAATTVVGVVGTRDFTTGQRWAWIAVAVLLPIVGAFAWKTTPFARRIDDEFEPAPMSSIPGLDLRAMDAADEWELESSGAAARR